MLQPTDTAPRSRARAGALRSRPWLAALGLFAGACATVGTQAPPPERSASETRGLFPADAASLPDQDIARIMDARWEVPEHVRIALLPLRHESVYGYLYSRYSATPLQGGMPTAFQAVEELRQLPFVYDVSYLPEFLLPEQKSLSIVREAGARYQADWVLVYSATVSAHPDYGFFGRDAVHGACLVECALLDTRSGLIPFTARSTEAIHVKEERSGEEMPVLMLRAEQQAVDAAMLANARSLIAFLDQVRS